MYFQEWKIHLFINIISGGSESNIGALITIELITNIFSYRPQVNRLRIVFLRDIKAHWVRSLHFFTVCKAIISRESVQGELRPIVFIPCDVSYRLQGNHLKRFGAKGH